MPKTSAQLDRDIAEALSRSGEQPFYGLRIVPSERTGYAPGKYVLQYKDRNGMWFDIGNPKSKAEAEAAQKRESKRLIRNPGRSHATMRSGKAGTWAVQAGRGVTYDRGDGRGPLLMFNLHRAVEPSTGSSDIEPTDLDEITREIAAFLNSKKRKLRPSSGY